MRKVSPLLHHGRLYGKPIITRIPSFAPICSRCLSSNPFLLSSAVPLSNNKSPSLNSIHKDSHFGGGSCFVVSSLQPTTQLRGRHLCHLPTATPGSDEEAPPSSYLSVRIQCDREYADMLAETLLSFGASSSSIEDSDDLENINKVFITSIFTEGEVVTESISLASSSIGMKEVSSFEVQKCEQRDWLKSFQESFHPIKIADSFWIIPEWRNPSDVHAINIVLNPGLAFGTGDHPTTRLCLLLLHEIVVGGENVLDYGTGSGILAISAIKLGASHSLGVDTDPQAITSACQNAALNNIGPDRMHLYLPASPGSTASRQEEDKNQNPYVLDPISLPGEYDIVVANILLNPLLDLAEKIACAAKPGGTVGLSGFLLEQLPQIEQCYSRFLENMSVSGMDGWVCLRGTRKI